MEKTVYGFALGSLALKVGIQLVVLLPGLDQISHQIRNFVIGYIHLCMLGIITGFLLGFALQNTFVNSKNILVSWGLKVFLIGFIVTEFLLFLQGIYLFLNQGALPLYQQYLFLASIGLPLGLLLVAIGINGKQSHFSDEIITIE
jgi:hypothetical protein